MKKFVFLSVILLFFASIASAESIDTTDSSASERETYWEIVSSVTYDTGDFGTNTRTNTVYVPLSLRRYFPYGDVAVTVPFIYQRSSTRVTALSGGPLQTSTSIAESKRSSGGIGDVLLEGRFYLLDEEFRWIDLSPMGEVKFPTADDDEGLGTGEFDYMIGLESAKSVGDYITLFANVYYSFIGEPDDFDLDNQLLFSGGTSFHIFEPAYLSVFYEEGTALVDGEENIRNITVGIDYWLLETLDLFGNVSAGLSESSPDVGVTIGMSIAF